MLVFVLNKHGKPLGKCKPQKARKLRKEGKVKVISYKPYTIQWIYGSSGYTQETELGIDLGSRNVGVAITSQNKVLSRGEIEFRQDVSSLIESRKILRRSRRNRKTRYRRCKFKIRRKRWFDADKNKWISKKIDVYTTRPAGWLPPSIQSRIDNTFFWIDKYKSLLPKCSLSIEVGKFDTAKMINPNIEGVEYQQGDLFGYFDVRYFVFARDSYTCQVCNKKKDKILNTHHIVYRSHGGTDRADNLITVCTDCHTSENHKEGNILWKWMLEKKKVKNYKEPPFMNTLRIRVFSKYPNARITYGSTTTPKRKELELEKTHYNDAIAITGIDYINENCQNVFKLKQFRKKKRSLHEATARKGRKVKNTTSKRNEKNTASVKGFHLNDKVDVFGKIGYITGFSGTSSAYVKDINDQYITMPGKSYKQVSISNLRLINKNNNWQYEMNWKG